MLAELASAVRDRRVSPSELVARAYERIERLNPDLGAVIRLRDQEEALAEAASVDRDAPLAGLPLLVKDNEHLAGLPTTYGSLLCRNRPPEERDGYIPGRLRAAGAIPVGKTNVPEFTFDGFTDNLLYGVTRNPWNRDWSPGGSSGGSGAALAAGMVPLATGTDGGGSIRIPATFCGLAGLKPTHGVVAREPIPAWIDLSTYGPLAVSVVDVGLLLGLMAGSAPGDPTALPVPLPAFRGLPSRAFATPRLLDAGPLPSSVAARFDEALRSVERDLGIPVEPLEAGSVLGPIGDPYADWFVTCAFEHLYLLGRDTVRANLDRFAPSFRSSMEEAMRIPPEDYMGARRRRFDYAKALDLVLDTDAVLLSPTIPIDGWAPDGRVPSTGRPATGAQGYNTDPINLTGHPALSVPAGVNENGVPFGLQVVGPRFADHLVLNLGEAWEAANPWPHAAPGYEPFEV